jgi:hypothetical protein
MSHLSRTRKRFAAWLCLAMMLFAQGAYAAHACGAVDTAMDEAMASMPCHQQQAAQEQQAEEAQIDKNLCQNHCLAGNQILDLAKIPVVAPSTVAVLPMPVVLADVALYASPFAEIPAHPGAPPIAVLHCCFRI